MMQIDTKKEGKTLTVAPKGNIDYITAPELDEIVNRESADCDSIVLDFKDVPYISSAGLRSILNADELMSGKNGLKVINISDDVSAVLEMTGFYDVLDIE